MSRIKKILLGVIIIFIAIQFITPPRNKSMQVLSTDITNTYSVPENVYAVLKKACYDCHSNNTRYPWYANLQPFGWQLQQHIKNGKKDLNFSEFGSYSSRRKINKLRAIDKSIKNGTMPLSSYTLLHKNARLTKDDIQLIIDWTNKIKDSLAQKN